MVQPEIGDDPLQPRLREILTRHDLPAFSANIHQILRSAGEESTSIRTITNIVLREYSISLKLLRTANSPLYNRSGRPIISVSHAASLMGIQAIRDLAAGTLLFEHFRTRSPGLRELMFLSLLTANHAREAAASCGYPRPEEAYLCGMFRNLGEILTACYLSPDYNRILLERKQHNLSDRLACRKVLRFTYEELGRAMVEHWGLPDSVRSCLVEASPVTSRITTRHRDFLSTIVSFSHQLTEFVYRSDPAGSRSRVRDHRDAFQLSLGLTLGQIKKILDSSVSETKETSRTLQIPLDTLRLQQQLDAAVLIESSPNVEADQPSEFADSLASTIESGQYELNDILLSILQSAFQSGPFDRVLFGLVDPGQNVIRGRVGLGANVDPLIQSFRFQLSMRGGPIALALLRKHDLFLFGDHDIRFDRSAFIQTLGSPNFLLCPVIVDDVVIGCLYGDRIEISPLPKSVQVEITKLRDVAAEAIRRKRAKL